MGKSVDLVTVLLGTWRIGAVYVPLFTAFAADAVRLAPAGRTGQARGRRRRPDRQGSRRPLDAARRRVRRLSWTAASLADALSTLSPSPRAPRSEATGRSCTCSPPAPQERRRASCTRCAMSRAGRPICEFALGVRDDSVYWCGADPGWAYGLYAAVVAPMALGLRSMLQRGGFDAAATWSSAGHAWGDRLRRRADRVPGAAHQRCPRARRAAPAAAVQRG